MKKAVSLLLALSMLFVLCACGQASEIKSATSMMEAGDYEGALATLTQLEADEEITAMIAECENAIAYENAVNLVNEGKYGEAHKIFSTIADYKDVSDYLAKYKTVEITVDNWNEYFEVRTIPIYIDDAFGEVCEITMCSCVVLNDEYSQKAALNDNTNILFEIKYDVDLYSASVDKVAHTFTYNKIVDRGSGLIDTACFDKNALTKEVTCPNYEAKKEIPVANAFTRFACQPDANFNWFPVTTIGKHSVTRTSGSLIIFN